MKKVAVIILMRGNVDLTLSLLNSIYTNDDYDLNYLDIYIADTGSSTIEKSIMRSYISKSIMNIKFIEYDYYNFAKINNDVVSKKVDKNTDYILLCNNDIQLINNAISKVINVYESEENIGTVGAMLLFPNLLIQHAGIKTYPTIGHYLLGVKYDKNIKGIEETFGNTGAFMLTSYKDWVEINGLNEQYECSYEDVEYNMKMIQKGKKNITCYDALCFHKESSTRHQESSEIDGIRWQSFYQNDKNLVEKSINLTKHIYEKYGVK